VSLIATYAVIYVRLYLTTLPQKNTKVFKFQYVNLHINVKKTDIALYINCWYSKPNNDG